MKFVTMLLLAILALFSTSTRAEQGGYGGDQGFPVGQAQIGGNYGPPQSSPVYAPPQIGQPAINQHFRQSQDNFGLPRIQPIENPGSAFNPSPVSGGYGSPGFSTFPTLNPAPISGPLQPEIQPVPAPVYNSPQQPINPVPLPAPVFPQAPQTSYGRPRFNSFPVLNLAPVAPFPNYHAPAASLQNFPLRPRYEQPRFNTFPVRNPARIPSILFSQGFQGGNNPGSSYGPPPPRGVSPQGNYGPPQVGYGPAPPPVSGGYA